MKFNTGGIELNNKYFKITKERIREVENKMVNQ